MISVIGAANSGKPKSSLTQYEKFVRLVFRRPALDCSAMRMRTQSSHARLPHSEVGWDPSRGNLRFERIVATLHRSS